MVPKIVPHKNDLASICRNLAFYLQVQQLKRMTVSKIFKIKMHNKLSKVVNVTRRSEAHV